MAEVLYIITRVRKLPTRGSRWKVWAAPAATMRSDTAAGIGEHEVPLGVWTGGRPSLGSAITVEAQS